MFSPRSPIMKSNNSNSNSNNKRQLIRPNNLLPWSVEVVSAVPGPVSELLETGPLSGATHKKWACLAFPKGIFYVWQIQNQEAMTGATSSLQSPKEYIKLILPDMIISPEQQDDYEKAEEEKDEEDGVGKSKQEHQRKQKQLRPLVALTTPPYGDDNDSVQLYALHPTTGRLVLRKIARRDMRTRVAVMTHTARTRINIVNHSNESDTTMTSPTDEDKTHNKCCFFRSLTSCQSMIVAVTSTGDLYWITHIAVPSSLHVQKVEANHQNSGFFNRLFYGGSSNMITDSSSSDQANTVVVVPVWSSSSSTDDTNTPQKQFLAVSKSAGIVRWTAELPIASGHHCIFTGTQIGQCLTRTISLGDEDWKVQEILRAVLSQDNRFLYCIIRGQIVETGEVRLYWIVASVKGIAVSTSSGTNDDEPTKATVPSVTIVRSHWLSRFAYPNQVRVLGLVSCENNNVYCALSIDGTVIVMALVPASSSGSTTTTNNEIDYIIQEIDLPSREAPDLVPNMMERDMVTFGCYMIATSGIGMRARFVMPPPQQQQSPSKRPRLLGGGNEGVLGQHLRSHFWMSYQDPTVDKPVPPSLTTADSTELELAILHIGTELQQKGDPSCSSISIEWHRHFIKLIKEGGLYRRLSEDGKWKLLGIGQELYVFGEMSQLLIHTYKHHQDDIVDEWQAGLQSHSIAQWLLTVQGSLELLHSEIWYDILGTALNTLLMIRDDHARSVYDIASEQCSEPIWTSNSSMRDMLKRQIQYWVTNHQENVPLELIEVVVKTALLSYSESLSPSSSVEDRMDYVSIQKSSITLLRLVISDGHDELAFDLCKQYRYFDGLCEISIAHEKKHDAMVYALDPLFDVIHGCDTKSGWSFSQHVLQWHTDRGLYGQVINYGRHSTADLNRIMNKNDQLRQYRWIPIIRQGYFSEATGMLLENCKENHGLRSNEWALSMAKLTNQLAPTQNQQTRDHNRQIEKTLTLVDAQKMLLDVLDDNQEKNEHNMDTVMMAPDELIELVMNKLENSFEQNERVNLAFVGLTVCNRIDDTTAAMEQTSRIWAECLLADGAKWTEWALEVGFGDDLDWLRQEALSDTVFGCLLEECRKPTGIDSMSKVTYGRDIETVVIDRVQGDDNREAFTRILRAVAAAPVDSIIQGQSLMVSSF